MSKMTKNEMILEAQKLESKYSDLLWFARSSPNHDSVPGVIEKRNQVLELYANEVWELIDEEAGPWHHGFNSGMLAGLRYILDLAQEGKEVAEENFPFLDS
jgi:hypothetical protein